MYRVRQSGLGAVDLFGHCTGILNPFNLVSPDCWAMAFPELLSPINAVSGANITQEQLQHPSTAYPNPPAPPVVGSTLPDGSAIPVVPADGAAGQATIDAIIADQKARANQQNLDFFASVNTNLQTPGGIPWWYWLVGGVAVFGLVASSGGSPRRYGR